MIRAIARSRGLLAGLGLVLLLGLAGLLWMERGTLQAWWYLRGLASAGEADREAWAERVAGLGETAVPGVLECLKQTDTDVCAGAGRVLERLGEAWGVHDARTLSLGQRCARDFGRLSPAGQSRVLRVAAGWFRPRENEPPAPASLTAAGARLVAEASSSSEGEVLAAALEVCAVLLLQPQGMEILGPGRDLVRGCLRADAPALRVTAVQVALHPGMDLLETVATLLADPAVEVRRAALLAVGPADQTVRDDTLLPCLHDPDAEVRRLCETALKSRGLGPEHLQLRRLLTHQHPTVRLEVLDHLRTAADLDPGVWLRRLILDPSPAVRVAALRVMSQQSLAVDLTDRIDQMAHSDPSPTVSALARFYLRQPRTSRFAND